MGSVSGLGRSPGERRGYPLQYSGPENPMDCIVQGGPKESRHIFHFHIKQITNKDLLLVTGNDTQYFAITFKGKECEKESIYLSIYMCVCVLICMYVSIYMCVYSVTQLCLTLCKPKDSSPPGSSVHEIFQARILECVAISYSRESSGASNQT